MKRKRRLNDKKILLTACCILMILLSGCSLKDTRIVFYSGLGKEEVFRMEGTGCMLPEFMIYLTATQNRYEKVYGEQIFTVSLEQMTLEENIKDMVLAQVSQIKAMNLLAKEEGVELESREKEQISQAATEFFSSLKERERKMLKIDEDTIYHMYEEYALAQKLYSYLIREVNPEVSDDEARTITVRHILVKTYDLDENKEPVFFSTEKKKEAYEKAKEALKQIKEGKDFEQVAEEYSEDTQRNYSFRKGEMEQAFELSAFNLAQGEISEIVETEYGYHIIQCISTFNQEETDANKIKIVEKKKEEAFNKRYKEYAKGLTTVLNEELWKKITLWKEEEINTEAFLSIFEKKVTLEEENSQ